MHTEVPERLLAKVPKQDNGYVRIISIVAMVVALHDRAVSEVFGERVTVGLKLSVG